MSSMELSLLASDPTGWWPAWENLLFNLAGAILGGSLVAWLSGYYSEKGKRKLIKEEFPTLLAQARDTAYETEKGKNLATKEDVHQVLEQVRAVTRETEAIKAEITSGVWLNQWRMAQQRDAYVAYITALTAYGAAWNEVGSANELAALEVAKRKVNIAADEFLRAQAVVTLFCGRHVHDANAAIHDALDAAGARVNEAFSANTQLPLLDDAALLSLMVNAARQDLGIPLLTD
jgi:hypothetical protein